MIMKMIENTLYHPHNLCSADQVVGHVRSPKAESFPMPARTPSKAAIRLWRWVATSWHSNAVWATPWIGWMSKLHP